MTEPSGRITDFCLCKDKTVLHTYDYRDVKILLFTDRSWWSDTSYSMYLEYPLMCCGVLAREDYEARKAQVEAEIDERNKRVRRAEYERLRKEFDGQPEG